MKSLCPTSNFLAPIRSPAPTSNHGDEDFDAHLDRNDSFYASSSVYFAPLLAGQSKWVALFHFEQNLKLRKCSV